MIELTGSQEFLIRPHIEETESIRSLLHRLIQNNKLSPRLFGETHGVAHATATALALAESAGWNSKIIQMRGAIVDTPGFAHGTIAVGISRLGRRSFVGTQRRVCPRCIAYRLDTPLAWEISLNCACHIHGCLLVDKCSSCKKPLEWLASDHECKNCGLRWSHLSKQAAPKWARTLANWVQTSVLRSITGERADGGQEKEQIRVRLDKLLLMIDVLRHVLLRRWLKPRIWDQFNLPWAVELLESHDFRFWLWNAIFLHAAKDPMTLAKALVPTGTALSVTSFYDHLATHSPVPGFVLDSLRNLKERRLVSQLSSLEIFDPRLHGILPAMQIMSEYRNNAYRVRRKRARIREFHEAVLEEQEAGFLMSPC